MAAIGTRVEALAVIGGLGGDGLARARRHAGSRERRRRSRHPGDAVVIVRVSRRRRRRRHRRVSRRRAPRGSWWSTPPGTRAREAYFGDLHVHTAYSFDAFAFGTIATPHDAYRYALGEAIRHPAGFDVQLQAPLDFLAVTDHAFFLGAVEAAADPTTAFSRYPPFEELHDLNAAENLTEASIPLRGRTFRTFRANAIDGIKAGEIDVETIDEIARTAWSEIIAAAEAFYEPGRFTTFVGYEYTAVSEDRGNLHRNVIFRGADRLPALPFSRGHSQDPERLWRWMDGLRAQGIEALAIPHNSNGSNGQMFALVDWAGDPLDDDYAARRRRNEPLVELTQIKGTSETHPALSLEDEWAGFEIMPYRVATRLQSEPAGSYARDALLRGLALEDAGLTNPYRFGFVGASDTHTGATGVDEERYHSKVGLLDGAPAFRGSVPLTPDERRLVEEAGRLEVREEDRGAYASGGYETWGAAGLTGVWADENTRDAIYDAFRRKETFATSGPRIRLRLFGGYEFDETDWSAPDVLTRAYATGVSMGSDLPVRDEAVPAFLVWALRDASSAAPATPADRQGVDGRRPAPRARLRCRLLRRRPRRPGDPPLPGQRRARRPVRLLEDARRRGQRAADGMDRPGPRSRPSCVLLRARARESHLPVVDLGCHPDRSAAPRGPPADDPGARLVVTDLARAAVTVRHVPRPWATEARMTTNDRVSGASALEALARGSQRSRRAMRSTWRAVVLGVLALGVTAGAQTDVAGEWEITLHTQTGGATWSAVFEQEGATLSGEINIGDREILPLEGTVDGDAIEFMFVMPDLDGDQPINLSGTVQGETIQGNDGNFSWYGAGDWTGVRQ